MTAGWSIPARLACGLFSDELADHLDLEEARQAASLAASRIPGVLIHRDGRAVPNDGSVRAPLTYPEDFIPGDSP